MKAKIILLLSLLLTTFSTVVSAAEKNDSTKIYFINAYDELKNMMEGKQPPDFERAVFISENAYHSNKYSYSDFQKTIDLHLFFIERLAAANDHSDTMNYIPKVKANGRFNIDEILISPEKNRQLYKNALNNWAIFTYMNDTTGLYRLIHLPFNYASADPFGMKDWSNSQVINLLNSTSRQGNCFALTGFFKIMANRMQTGAYICTAPQHIYIQHQDNKGDYYNVELATAGHPGDGMLQTLTYTTSKAIDNGIALRSYDDKQSIGLCLVNLAKSYEHTFNTKDDDFILQCAETVLQNDSLNLNALLLKQQVLNERMLKYISQNKTTAIAKLITDKKASITFYELEKHLARLSRLGYIQMPMDIQEIVLNGFKEKENVIFVDKNPKPFDPLTGVPENENQYMTLTSGLFQEVFETRKLEEYGQFTFDTETQTIVAIDTTKKNIFLIDPVAFAYDFGARMYDSRTGLFMSVDPLAKKYAGWSPYAAFVNNPILFVDPDGNEVVGVNEAARQNILNTLTPEDRKYVAFDDKGYLDVNKLSQANSTSGNYHALLTLANSTTVYKFIEAQAFPSCDENGYEISEALVNDETNGAKGITLIPTNENNPSFDPDVWIYTSDALSDERAAENTAHEGYGHAYFYELTLKGQSVQYNHNYESILIEVDPTKTGIERYGFGWHDVNEKLKQQIDSSEQEAKKNFNSK